MEECFDGSQSLWRAQDDRRFWMSAELSGDSHAAAVHHSTSVVNTNPNPIIRGSNLHNYASKDWIFGLIFIKKNIFM